MSKPYFSALLLVFLVIIQGCSKDKEDKASQTPSAAKPEAAVQTTPPRPVVKIQDPTILRAQLPNNTLVYLRVPNILDYLSSPKGDYLSGAFANKQHEQLVRELHTALYERVLTPENIAASPWHTLLLRDIRSPMELAVLPGSTTPYPVFVLTMRLAHKNVSEVNRLLKQLEASTPRLVLIQDMNPDGYAAMGLGVLGVHMHFQEKTRVLRVMAGLSLSDELFRKTLSELKDNPKPPIVALESEIDESRHGLFYWMNLEGVFTAMQAVIPPEKLSELQKRFSGINKLAFGWGVSKAKGRIKLLLETRKQGIVGLIPVVNNKLALHTSGEPGTVMNLSLPSRVQLKQIEDYVASVSAPRSTTNYQEFKRKFTALTGFAFEDFLDAFGPEVVAFKDKTGEFMAMRIRNEEAFAKFQQVMQSKGVQKEVAGKVKEKIYHVSVPSLWNAGGNKPGKKQTLLVQVLSKGNTHLYWYRDKDYVVMAPIPQMLRDRLKYPTHINLGRWMKENQRQDISASLLSLTTTIPDSPRKLYYGYLQLLEYLGDLAEVNLNMATLPSATELRLPASGTYGMHLTAGQQHIGLELVFENNPMEFLAGQNAMTGVAVVGILAAIAIPAYQDYTIRAQVSEALAQTGKPKVGVAEYWYQHGKFPDANEARLMEGRLHPRRYVREIRILPGKGSIVLTLTGGHKMEGRQIVLTPNVLPGSKGLSWTCRGTLERKYLPISCR